jgi:hypothetical protein
VIIPILSDFELEIVTDRVAVGDYPTNQLRRGFLLFHHGQDLSEEGVGFGVPVLKRGFQTVFPGDIDLEVKQNDAVLELTAIFKMNLVERISRPSKGIVKSRSVYNAKNSLAALIRSIHLLRAPLTGVSNLLRGTLGWETTFEEAGLCSYLRMVYTLDGYSGLVNAIADTSDLVDKGLTEVIIMNEQGARCFDQYMDSNGILLRGKEIGCWDRVSAKEASFISNAHQVAFTLTNVEGARLFRGRELVGSRLAWAGFGYTFPPTYERFTYELRLRQLL